MDVNGTRFHLLNSCADWSACRLVTPTGEEGATLAESWQPGNDAVPLEWNWTSRALRLARSVPLFRRSARTEPLDVGQRRGAGRDAYGNWYWIDEAQTGLRFLPVGKTRGVAYWRSEDLAATCAPPLDGTFVPKPTVTPAAHTLCGLAVTTRHYLVVGDLTEHGLLVFDLHGGGAPLLVRWPADTPFAPWDIAPLPNGGVLVLDRDNLVYWVLDENLRTAGIVEAGARDLFQPRDGEVRQLKPRTVPTAYSLLAPSPPAPPPDAGDRPLPEDAWLGPLCPVSIEPGPAGTVLILDTDPDRPYSLIYEMAGEELVQIYSLEDAATVFDPAQGEGVLTRFSVAGHDFAWAPAPETSAGTQLGSLGCSEGEDTGGEASPGPEALVYVAERDGNQVLAFELDRETGEVVPLRDYFPLRRWQARALVAAGDAVYYDFRDRWVRVQALMDCQYAGEGALTTPADFSLGLAGEPFDSAQMGCTWHRLMLDAQIPAGTSITVQARAADDPELLKQTGWIDQPLPYLRDDGAEIPYLDPWIDLDPRPDRTGTWELLFQGVAGRYVQIRLTLTGTGRSTPAVRNLRAWYPRFSYLDEYLPAIYREEPVAASFAERWLANFEGFYTVLEDRIEHVSALFDPRTAPPETLGWLACWFGVALDPLWEEDRRRFFIRHADQLYRRRGTLAGVEIALRLYLEERPGERLFDADCLGQGRVRIVEHYRTRSMGGLVYGDPTDPTAPRWRPLTRADVQANAHQFSVLVPHDLNDEQVDMVRRIVELEKPAHTAFVIKRYWDMFRVGEARLGLDTRLGLSSRYTPLLLGVSYVPEGYLAAAYPFDVGDRVISDRDRLGDLPAL